MIRYECSGIVVLRELGLVDEVKEWYVKFDGKKEGPFSISDLRQDRRITPETLVWKEGYKDWVPIGKVKELKKVFVDEGAEQQEPTDKGGDARTRITPDGLVIDARNEPPNVLLWIAVLLLLFLYVGLKFKWIL